MTTTPISNITAHWSNSAQTLVGFGLNVVDTGHDANSRVFLLKVNGNTIFDIDATGNITGNISVVSSNSNSDPQFAFDKANSAYTMANAAFLKANSVSGGDLSPANAWANSLSITTGTSANNRAGLMANAANAYAASLTQVVDLSPANGYATSVGASSNAWTNSVATSVGSGANNQAGLMANAANAYAGSLTTSLTPANNWANTQYSNALSYANAVGVGSNNFTGVVFGRANAAYDLANGAYNYANTLSGESDAVIFNQANAAFAQANAAAVAANSKYKFYINSLLFR